MIYLAIFFLLTFFSLVHDFAHVRKGSDFSYFLSYVVLVSLAAFRYKVGGDTYNYMFMHEFLPSLTEVFSTEVGIEKLQPMWILFSATAKSINDEFYVLQLLHALIVNASIFLFISKNTAHRHTAVLFYYFSIYPYFNFEILRESLAVACFLTSIGFYNSRRWGIYYLINTVAFMFHFSATILLLLPLLQPLKPRIAVMPLIFLACALLNPVMTELIQSTPATALLGFYSGYSDYRYTVWGLLSLFLFSFLAPLLIAHVARNTFRIECSYYDMIGKGLLFASLTPLLYIFARFSNYFSIFFVLLSSEILHRVVHTRSTHPMRALYTPVVFVCFLGLFTFRYFGDTSKLVPSTRWYSYWYPYYSIFDPDEDPVRERLTSATNANLQ